MVVLQYLGRGVDICVEEKNFIEQLMFCLEQRNTKQRNGRKRRIGKE
jgi:hypothetical protein